MLVSMWSVGIGEVKDLSHKWTNITIHVTKIAICCVNGPGGGGVGSCT